MIKDNFKQELQWKGVVGKGDTGFNVQRVQEWLSLQCYSDPTWNFPTTVDGGFGPMTEATVIMFQKHHKIEVDGIVGSETFAILCAPMREAFSMAEIHKKYIGKKKVIKPKAIRAIISLVAEQHIKACPRELRNRNEGPWVRAYMGGHDGSPWEWCVGSTLTIIDQALSACGKEFTDYTKNTYGCDVLGADAKKRGTLVRNRDLRTLSPSELRKTVQVGDILNLANGPYHWRHTMLIVGIEDDSFITFEGNTNDEGSAHGFEACNMIRNFQRQELDVIKLDI